MWEAKNQNRYNAQPMIEVLEDRQMMSVAAHQVAAPKAPTPHSVVMSVKPAAKPAAKPVVKAVAKPVVKAVAKPAPKPIAKPAAKAATKPVAAPTPQEVFGQLPAFIPATNLNMAPNIIGTWTGTMQVDGSTQTNPFSVNFAFQRGIAASGTFNLGPTVGNQSLASTMVFGTNHNMRALILTKTLWMGFTGALTANGQVMYGRFAVNTSGGWETGSYTLTKNA